MRSWLKRGAAVAIIVAMIDGMDELWSAHHEESAEGLVEALERGDLTDALLHIEGADPVTARRCRDQLDAWSDAARTLVEALTADERREHGGRLLGHVLAQVAGLARSELLTWHAPSNSHLSRVVESRRGLPILLSAVWMIVGRAAGLEVDGIGMPGHFIVRVGGAGGQLRDPFGQGRALTVESCQALVSRVTQTAWRAEFLRPTPLQAMLERVLRNLLTTFERSGDAANVYRTANMLARLRELDPSAQLLHARAAIAVGAETVALRIYEEVMVRFPDSREASLARLQHKRLRERERLLN